MNKSYNIELVYGYEDSTCGIYHSFIALDPEVMEGREQIEEELMEDLDCSEEDLEDGTFNYDSMDIALPETLVAKIKADALAEQSQLYAVSVKGQTFHFLSNMPKEHAADVQCFCETISATSADFSENQPYCAVLGFIKTSLGFTAVPIQTEHEFRI